MSVSSELRAHLACLLDTRRKELEEQLAAQANPPRGMKVQFNAVKKAATRIADPSFGFCEGCWVTIPARELLEMPERTKCSTCMTNADKKKRRRSA